MAGPMIANLPTFLAELKRRRLFRVIAYWETKFTQSIKMVLLK